MRIAGIIAVGLALFISNVNTRVVVETDPVPVDTNPVPVAPSKPVEHLKR